MFWPACTSPVSVKTSVRLPEVWEFVIWSSVATASPPQKLTSSAVSPTLTFLACSPVTSILTVKPRSVTLMVASGCSPPMDLPAEALTDSMVPLTLALTSTSSAFSRSLATSSCFFSMAFFEAAISTDEESPRFCLNTRSSSACLVDFTVSAALDALESLSTAACWSVICALREEIC